MGVKIWWQDILPSTERSIVGGDAKIQQEIQDRLLGTARKVARDGTVIEPHPVKYSSYAFNASYLEMLNNVWIIDGIIEIQGDQRDTAADLLRQAGYRIKVAG